MTSTQIQQKVKVILSVLKKLYPDPKIALDYGNNLELLIAVVLSAQCTDKKVNEVTEKLFTKYTTLDAYADADIEEFGQDIRSTGFYRNKAKNVIGLANMIRDKHDGKVPDTMEELTALPGVARKSANVVLSVAYGKHEGVIVDTHIRRLSNKYGLTKESNPVKIERDLMSAIPQDKWHFYSSALVLYGREYSTARQVKDIDDPISVALAAGGLL